MKKTKKILMLVLCAALLVGASVMGTVAYLTDTDDATNTFTIGAVDIELKEYELADNGYSKTETEVGELKDIKLIPGREIEKNPFITVGEDSEDCWLFVVVENGLGDAVTINWVEGDWVNIDGTNVWQYKEAVEAGEKVDVFPSITCSESLTNAQFEEIESKNIVITAYAVQADGVRYEEAFAALDMHYFD